MNYLENNLLSVILKKFCCCKKPGLMISSSGIVSYVFPSKDTVLHSEPRQISQHWLCPTVASLQFSRGLSPIQIRLDWRGVLYEFWKVESVYFQVHLNAKFSKRSLKLIKSFAGRITCRITPIARLPRFVYKPLPSNRQRFCLVIHHLLIVIVVPVHLPWLYLPGERRPPG